MSQLKVKNVMKAFGHLKVLNDVSLEVAKGEHHVIIGPNGAGKTTLFNCITRLLSIDSGTVHLEDQEISNVPSNRLVHLGISRTFQKNNLFGNLTVEENIQLAITAQKPYRFQILKSLAKYRDLAQETHELLEQWDMTDRRNTKVNNLSYGEQRILEVVLALASKPKLLLLDEPTSGMSVVETHKITELIQKLPESVTLLVIEHDMEVVFSIADRITVLHHGEVITSGAPEEVRNNDHINEIYFGGGAKANA